MNDHNYFSWGRLKRASAPQVIKPNNYEDLLKNLKKHKKLGKVLPIGLMRSYGDSCLIKEGLLLDMTEFKKINSFDEQSGLINVQAGISLDELLKFIVPKGWFIPTSPGTKYVTIGGAIANDIHGKNHHKFGSFCNSVKKIKVLSTDGKLQLLEDPDDEMFKATCGGLGLTGLILEAEIELAEIKSSYLNVETIKFNNLEEFFEIEKQSIENYEFTVSWIDLTNESKYFGRGLFQRANWADDNNFMPHSSFKIPIPFGVGFNLVSKKLMKLFNFLYFSKNLKKKTKEKTHYGTFFYPLDVLRGWNKLYGKNGFSQYQFVLPEENSKAGLDEMLEVLKNDKFMPRLCVLKTFGKIPSLGHLSFPLKGTTLAMDFPVNIKKIKNLYSKLDEIVIKNGGRIYPAKDSFMNSKTFQSSYKNFHKFKKFKDTHISSDFWERVS